MILVKNCFHPFPNHFTSNIVVFHQQKVGIYYSSIASLSTLTSTPYNLNRNNNLVHSQGCNSLSVNDT